MDKPKYDDTVAKAPTSSSKTDLFTRTDQRTDSTPALWAKDRDVIHSYPRDIQRPAAEFREGDFYKLPAPRHVEQFWKQTYEWILSDYLKRNDTPQQENNLESKQRNEVQRVLIPEANRLSQGQSTLPPEEFFANLTARGQSFLKEIQSLLKDKKNHNVFYGDEADQTTYQRRTYAFIRNANYSLEKGTRGPQNMNAVFDSSIKDHMAYEEMRHVQLAKDRGWLKVDNQLHSTIEEALIKMELFNKRGVLRMDKAAQDEVREDHTFYIDTARRILKI